MWVSHEHVDRGSDGILSFLRLFLVLGAAVAEPFSDLLDRDACLLGQPLRLLLGRVNVALCLIPIVEHLGCLFIQGLDDGLPLEREQLPGRGHRCFL